MALTRSQVNRAGVTQPFSVGEGTITFHYRRPSPVYFDEMQKALSSVKDEDRTLAGTLANQLLPLLTDWDYTEDDGKKLEINDANLLSLPTGVLRQVAEYIIETESSDTKNAPTPSETSS